VTYQGWALVVGGVALVIIIVAVGYSFYRSNRE
jgi:hypothetical protein